jgi:hypothetical protein
MAGCAEPPAETLDREEAAAWLAEKSQQSNREPVDPDSVDAQLRHAWGRSYKQELANFHLVWEKALPVGSRTRILENGFLDAPLIMRLAAAGRGRLGAVAAVEWMLKDPRHPLHNPNADGHAEAVGRRHGWSAGYMKRKWF